MSKRAITPTPISAEVRKFVSKPRRLLINNKWVEAVSGQTFPVIDPATGTEFARVAEGEAADIDRAVRAARAAFE